MLRLLELRIEVNESSGKYGTALQAAAFAGDAVTVALLLQHDANPQLEGGLHGNPLNAAARMANIDVLNHLLEEALPYAMLDGAILQAVVFPQDEVVNALLKKGASVEARDDELDRLLSCCKNRLQWTLIAISVATRMMMILTFRKKKIMKMTAMIQMWETTIVMALLLTELTMVLICSSKTPTRLRARSRDT